jgi:GNAT superfamily N-acetyltransferase
MTKLTYAIEVKLLADCQEFIPQLAVLWYEGISKHWVPTASVVRAQENLKKHLNRDSFPLTFVAIYQGQPVGMASLRDNDGIRDDLTPWLGSLVVLPDYQSYGIGKLLIDRIKECANTAGFKKLYLLAFDSAIPTWYTQLGWQEIGDDHLFGHPVAVMSIDMRA